MKKIGVDIDGVITDTASVFLDYVYKIYGKKYELKDITEYFFEEILDLTVDEVNSIWNEIFKDNIWENIPPLEDAVEVLREIQKKYPLYIITARPEFAREGTEKWFKKYGIRYEKLVFANLETKLGFLKNEKIELTHFIEDRWEFAVELSKEGIEVILLNQPWNINKGNMKGIRRVDNWKEIRKIILDES